MDAKDMEMAIENYKNTCEYLNAEILGIQDAHMCLEQSFTEEYGEEALMSLYEESWEQTRLKALEKNPDAENLLHYEEACQKLKDELHDFGYHKKGMDNTSKEDALYFFRKQSMPIYLLSSDNTEKLAESEQEIMNHDGLFGIRQEDNEKFSQQLIQNIFGDILTADEQEL